MLTLAAPSAAQPQASPAAPRTIGYTVFFKGTPIGREEVTVRTDPNGITVSSQGRLSSPANITLQSAEVRYHRDWTPESFAFDSTLKGADLNARTTFTDGVAGTEGAESGTRFTRSHQVAARTIVLLPNAFFGGFEALTRRLADTPDVTAFRAYVVPQAEVDVRVTASVAERMQVGTSLFSVRRYEVVLENPGGDLAFNLTAAEDGSLVRISIPAQAFDVVRADVAASTSRTQIFSNPGDEAVVIPAVGFNLGATLTRPRATGGTGGEGRSGGAAAVAARLPAVILLAGSGVDDRDGAGLGPPTLAQLAGSLANAGFLAVRYDKRGFGQSGGRAESATLSDSAEDVRSVVKWLAARRDIAPKRIAVIGHGEGAWVGLLAASLDKRIAAVVSLAGAGSTGAELTLEQQQLALAQANLAPADRDARVALQKRIHSAVLTGKGWEGVSRDLRQQADTPWFQSLLAFDPAKPIEDVRQPMLFIHGALDKQVPVVHADRLADLARKESDSTSVEVVIVRGVNHLLVPAETGEVSEYGTLRDRDISPDVTSTINTWLTKTFASAR